ncbi:glycoside hydrolase family 140 protein [Pedobacter rhizosphaerae]|uniref:Putative collagen-binding domain of a collagenase n=1 Tax=Pedobacter rhizosphaerae TaxID=390241 RepID=A0A1H9KKX2_9SPHI|nr:glycoside hydrolase family 140 protein [Pedobacter rhizosphaerae]SEQ99752.1 Putative collagen-binding domain of a collagenase [Pedobacter rhizosphaerae]
MRFNKFYIYLLIAVMATALGCKSKKQADPKSLLVSENGRFLTTGDGKPFFWLGDTAWLLFSRLTREEADTYLEDRKQKGFNVIQVMLLHDVPSRNVYLDSSLVRANVAKPAITPGSNYKKADEYDYWDNVDYIIDKAAEKGLYMALVPVWGTNVKEKKVKEPEAKVYAEFLAKRYRDRWNIIWLDGGDIKGSDGLNVWTTIGKTLRANDPNHLITFHPRGRTASSQWFHNAAWSDFNMIQSGHRRYDQDTSKNEKLHYGEDNWKYIEADYKLTPVKPTIDGEPSYEDIPQGLHDTTQPRWTAADVRRYGYWSVFAGAFGYTYGHNSVMQMYKVTDKKPAYGPKDQWITALNAAGATQMKYLKDLMLSRSYFDRVPDQSVIAGQNGEKYDRLLATRGADYVMVYTYTGRNINLNMGKIEGENVKASWFNPRDGKTTLIGAINNKGTHTFDPPGEVINGNDWVLILDKI